MAVRRFALNEVDELVIVRQELRPAMRGLLRPGIESGCWSRLAAARRDAEQPAVRVRRKKNDAVPAPCAAAPVRSLREDPRRPAGEIDPPQRPVREETKGLAVWRPEGVL